MRRAEAAGYRPGWRGGIAYLFSPWLWRPVLFALFIAGMVVLTAGLLVAAALGRAPLVGVPLTAVAIYLFAVRPVAGVVRRRSSAI